MQIRIFGYYVSALNFETLHPSDKIKRVYLTRKVYAFLNGMFLEHGQMSFKAVTVITDHV